MKWSHRVVYVAAAGAAMVCFATAALAAEPKPAFKANAALSYARTSGNTDTQALSATLDASYEPDANRYYGKAGAFYGKNDGVATQNKWYLDGRYERGLTKRFFVFGAATYTQDKFSGYDYQLTLGPGVGYEFIKTDRQELKGRASVVWARDKFSHGGSDSYAAGVAAAHYAWQITKDVTFKEVADYRVSFKDTKVYFMDSDSRLEVKVASNLSLGIGYIVNYQHELPSEGLKHTDTTFLTSLVFSY